MFQNGCGLIFFMSDETTLNIFLLTRYPQYRLLHVARSFLNFLKVYIRYQICYGVAQATCVSFLIYKKCTFMGCFDTNVCHNILVSLQALTNLHTRHCEYRVSGLRTQHRCFVLSQID